MFAFLQENQFGWMLDKFLDVQKSHPLEDELMCSVLRVGICKAVAVLGVVATPEAPDLTDRLKKSIETGLKSPCLGRKRSR